MKQNLSKKQHHTHWLLEGAIIVAALSTLMPILLLGQYPTSTALYLVKFSVAQWTPYPFLDLSYKWQKEAWVHFEDTYLPKLRTKILSNEDSGAVLKIPTVHVQDFSDPANLLQHVESTFGKDWRRKPLLLKGLWDLKELKNNKTRRLSQTGLLQEELAIPYFRDARLIGALSPNDVAPVKDIVTNITQQGAPHKIGTQFLIQSYPELIQEVAPAEIVKALFGDRFQPKHVVGAFGLPFLPATTTVPLFVAGSTIIDDKQNFKQDDRNNRKESLDRPFTALHCEPIGNVAVQLEGEKQWTLVSPEHSFMIRPSASPDGRAFFVSDLTAEKDMETIPKFYATTGAGDAIWVPTWTWHRVDYRMSPPDDIDADANEPLEAKKHHIAIGASLFHLRPMELLGNNPLFAVLVVPNLLKELFRFKTQ